MKNHKKQHAIVALPDGSLRTELLALLQEAGIEFHVTDDGAEILKLMAAERGAAASDAVLILGRKLNAFTAMQVMTMLVRDRLAGCRAILLAEAVDQPVLERVRPTARTEVIHLDQPVEALLRTVQHLFSCDISWSAWQRLRCVWPGEHHGAKCPQSTARQAPTPRMRAFAGLRPAPTEQWASGIAGRVPAMT